MSARKVRRKKYGDTNIGGNAQVQLGDRYTTQHIVIEKAYFRFHKDFNLPSIDALRRLVNHNHLLHNGLEVKPQENADHNGGPSPKAGAAEETVGIHQPIDLASLAPQLKMAGNPMLQRYTDKNRLFKLNDHSRLNAACNSVGPRSEVVVVTIVLLSYIVGQNIPLEQVGHLLRACQKNQLLGLMTGLLGYAVYYYLIRGGTETALLPATLLLEDAFGHTRPVSFDVCIDPSLFFEFLRVHYRDTNGYNARDLVNAGQHHLTIGSRRGTYVDPSNWQVMSLPAGTKLVNSVYLTRETADCIKCSKSMVVNEMGEFYCRRCKAVYRDRDTFVRNNFAPVQQVEPSEKTRDHSADQWQNPEDTCDRDDALATASSSAPRTRRVPLDVSRLLNIDLHIIASTVYTSDRAQLEEGRKCPLCLEDFDLADQHTWPCPCGYQICQNCFYTLKTTSEKATCPNCRRLYDDAKVQYKTITAEALRAEKSKRHDPVAADTAMKHRSTEPGKKKLLARQRLRGVLVEDPNLVCVVGLQRDEADDSKLAKILRGKNYFGQYGTIEKLVISRIGEFVVYVRFRNPADAARCINRIDGIVNGSMVRPAILQ